ncbi:AAA family ATPase [Pararhizobium sp. IMCC21322]|uniref:AAA family ATPase n=1 Tax=Pararhizobium sp. IMCC21322 TaxID=3067903 RepID=UPI002741BB5B|nr:AAA family ATPase [Pararhizobium sp. IMCC21322]
MAITEPAAPTTVLETGIKRDSLMQLLAKTLLVHGALAPSQIATEMRLAPGVVVELLKELQKLQYVESRGLEGHEMRSEVRFSLGGAGVHYANRANVHSQYIGSAPVSLEDWVSQIRNQSIANERISREVLQDALSHLILPENIVSLVGPAINSTRSVLLYGEPGNGKTSIAEAMGKAFRDLIYIPHCVEVGGQIINVFDPTLHTPEEEDYQPKSRQTFDRRWRRCRRPFALTGGELTLEMLDLSYNPDSRYYEAPIHLKAIGGVFVVDDFGRQRTNPQAVLNRWIVPLERRYDFLTLHTGKKFAVPFDQLAIFSTNIPPDELADAGALRRLHYKINVPTPSADDYRVIFEGAAKKAGLPFDSDVFEAFFDRHYANGKATPAGHHPKYIVDFITSVCRFKSEELRMDADLLDGGWNNLTVN